MEISIDEIISRYKQGSREALLPLLQDIQDVFGYLNEEAVLKVGKHINLPTAKVYGIATFYDQFRFLPKGKNHIKLCRGTSCHMHGSLNLLLEVERILNIKVGQTTRDGRFSLELVSCVGACSAAPVLNINGEFHIALSVQDIVALIEKYRNNY